ADSSTVWDVAVSGLASSSPAIGDVIPGGGLEVVFGSANDSVYVLTASGQRAPGWPRPLELTPGNGRVPSPVLARLLAPLGGPRRARVALSRDVPLERDGLADVPSRQLEDGARHLPGAHGGRFRAAGRRAAGVSAPMETLLARPEPTEPLQPDNVDRIRGLRDPPPDRAHPDFRRPRTPRLDAGFAAVRSRLL